MTSFKKSAVATRYVIEPTSAYTASHLSAPGGEGKTRVVHVLLCHIINSYHNILYENLTLAGKGAL